ncbi:Malic enzyme [Paratrimastix pyriformis]|uniref:Malic enzyme n=1 Tax=Paratrimastix pyriformis TaxID=342808 RepID=A0ABQ8UD51_9EUKA|nr:Malic enzyme [Paratrimastix pyriformis]
MKKFMFLSELFEVNVNLFYKLVTENFPEIAPYIYTPHVGQYCLKLHEVWRPKQALFYSLEDRAHIDEITSNWPRPEVDIVVVTDGGRILGLGDQGCNGIGIPIGKLALYVAGAGSDPRKVLPVQIDAGTNNVALRSHPLYMGLNRPRLQGEEYFQFVADVVSSIHRRWPKALIQFEDFGTDNAFELLRRWQNQMLCFNDDIQGTGAVTLACLMNAARSRGWRDLSQERVVIVGAGSAGLGISDAVCSAMVKQCGMTLEEARSHFYLLDINGLLGTGRSDLTVDQRRYQRTDMRAGMNLAEVVAAVHPSTMIGVTGTANLFTEEILREVCAHCEKPLIMPMSNPTSKAECTLEQALERCHGKCIFASGSPFKDATKDGHTLVGNQCNNMYIFPALGLAACACHATKVTDNMLYAAGMALSAQVTDEQVQRGQLFPSLANMRDISARIVVAVVRQAVEDGVAAMPEGCTNDEQLMQWARSKMWVPDTHH